MSSLRTDVASAVVWLSNAQAGALLRTLVSGDEAAIAAALLAALPELASDLTDPAAREVLLEELDFRIAPPSEEEDPDSVLTTEVPDWTRYAPDRRGD